MKNRWKVEISSTASHTRLTQTGHQTVKKSSIYTSISLSNVLSFLSVGFLPSSQSYSPLYSLKEKRNPPGNKAKDLSESEAGSGLTCQIFSMPCFETDFREMFSVC